jgi:hypothetical protein
VESKTNTSHSAFQLGLASLNRYGTSGFEPIHTEMRALGFVCKSSTESPNFLVSLHVQENPIPDGIVDIRAVLHVGRTVEERFAVLNCLVDRW